MAIMDGNRVRWQYTDDAGNTWAVSAKKEYVTLVDTPLGGAAGAATLDPLPSYIKPRRCHVKTATGVVRQVICYSPTATAWTTPGTTFQMNINGASVAVEVQKGRTGERFRDTCTQAS